MLRQLPFACFKRLSNLSIIKKVYCASFTPFDMLQRSWSDDLPRSDSMTSIAGPPLCGRYEWRRPIGRGGFGLVTLCRDLLTNTYVAVKTISSNVLKTEFPRVVREIEIMSTLAHAHPHVLSLLEYFVTIDPTCEGSLGAHGWLRYVEPYSHVMQQLQRLLLGGASSPGGYVQHYDELMAQLQLTFAEIPSDVFAVLKLELHVVMPLMHGDLHKLLRPSMCEVGVPSSPKATAKAELYRTLAVPFAFQLCFAVDFLHKSNVVHRDLKPENILVWLDDQVPLNSSVFVADFGLARDQTHSSNTWYICTRYYRPPEVVLRMGTPDSSMDMWSVGCILYELVTHDVLFRLPSSRDQRNQYTEMRASRQLDMILGVVGVPSVDDIHTHAANWSTRAKTYLQECPSRTSSLASRIRDNWALASTEHIDLWIDLIGGCLQFFPQQRYTAHEACSHDLFRLAGVNYGETVKQHPRRLYAPDVDVMTLPEVPCLMRVIRGSHDGFFARVHPTVEYAQQTRRARSPPLAPIAPDDVPPDMSLGLAQVIDAELHSELSRLPLVTDDDIANAIGTAVDLLLQYTHDPLKSAQLNAALRFFTTLRDIPKTEVVYGVHNDEEGPFFDDLA